VNVSTTLPAKPHVFHGRDDWVSDAIRLLVERGTSSRLAILGPGGIGKTTVALALLYNSQIVERYPGGRLFLSCEALLDANAIVVSLAKLLDVSASSDLLTAVVTRLAGTSPTILVLDNLESVWLKCGAPDMVVDGLLGKLAQIPSLSLVITCRGTELPQSVEWSNSRSTELVAFSLEAALQTFQDRVERRFTSTEEEDKAKELFNAVDRMPLAVSLLGQLSRRGNSVSALLERWKRERTSLLRTHGDGRFSNVEVSIELSIKMLYEADPSRGSLELLSICSMLPDGLRQDIIDKLRPKFKHIDRARDSLAAYSLVSLSTDGVLKMLSPIRHYVLESHPPQPEHREALYLIYFDIAQQLPATMDEHFKEVAAVVVPEIDNLSSLLLTQVHQPSQQIVDAVIGLTWFAYHQQPTAVTAASALLPHLESHPKWKAQCLLVIGNTQIWNCNYTSAIESLGTAAQLFLEVGDHAQTAWCQRLAGIPYRQLGMYEQAEKALNTARDSYIIVGDHLGEAMCRSDLGRLMRMKKNHAAAIEHLLAARQAFNTLGEIIMASHCSESLSHVYLEQGDNESAAVELERARSHNRESPLVRTRA